MRFSGQNCLLAADHYPTYNACEKCPILSADWWSHQHLRTTVRIDIVWHGPSTLRSIWSQGYCSHLCAACLPGLGGHHALCLLLHLWLARRHGRVCCILRIPLLVLWDSRWWTDMGLHFSEQQKIRRWDGTEEFRLKFVKPSVNMSSSLFLTQKNQICCPWCYWNVKHHGSLASHIWWSLICQAKHDNHNPKLHQHVNCKLFQPLHFCFDFVSLHTL